MSHGLFLNHARKTAHETEMCALTKRANTFSLSSGERAGVRASVTSDICRIYFGHLLRSGFNPASTHN